MSQPVIRIRGHIRPDKIARLLKKKSEPTLAEVLRLMVDQFGSNGLELEVEVHLNPDVNMKEDRI